MIELKPSSLVKLEKLREKTKGYKALLFDVDGTLANNMPAHKAAYIAAAKHYGIPDLDPALIDRTAGWPTYILAAEIARLYDKEFDNVEFANLKADIFIKEFVHLTQPVDFVYAHMLESKEDKRIALVSGGRKSTLAYTLKAIGAEGHYELLVSSEDTEKGKPSPQPFLLAAEQLNVAPEDCIVMEDGDPGVQGAIAAGMGWVRIDLL